MNAPPPLHILHEEDLSLGGKVRVKDVSDGTGEVLIGKGEHCKDLKALSNGALKEETVPVRGPEHVYRRSYHQGESMQSGWRQGVRGDAGGGCQGMQVAGGAQGQARALLSFEWKGSHCLMGRGMNKSDVFTGWLWLVAP